jgi:hypothetical protein
MKIGILSNYVFMFDTQTDIIYSIDNSFLCLFAIVISKALYINIVCILITLSRVLLWQIYNNGGGRSVNGLTVEVDRG